MTDAFWLYDWVKQFSPWQPVEVMPAETSLALMKVTNRQQLMTWIQTLGSLTELSVWKYAQKLLQKLHVANFKLRSRNHGNFSILALQFLYSGIHAKKILRDNIVNNVRYQWTVRVVDQSNSLEKSVSLKLRGDGVVLLPEGVSKWPSLFARAQFRHLIVLSDQYLDPQCSLVDKIVNKSSGPDSFLLFIKDALGAVDLPLMRLHAVEGLPFNHPVTMEKSVLLL